MLIDIAIQNVFSSGNRFINPSSRRGAMKTGIIIAGICCFFVFPALAFCQSSPGFHGWSGNANFFLGEKGLDSGDWKPVEEHMEYGLLLDFKHHRVPFGFTFDILHSEDEENVGVEVLGFGVYNSKVKSQTTEFNPGIRKIWENFQHARPFIGGGASVVIAEIDVKALGNSVSDDGAGLGAWMDLGLFWAFNRHFNLGVDARYSYVEATVLNMNSRIGGWHLGVLAGYHW